NQAICAISPKSEGLDLSYLRHYIVLARDRLVSLSSGGAQPHISQEIIRNFKIAIPSVKEQQQIADVLSKADEKLEIERNQRDQLKEAKHALMDLLLSGRIRTKVS